MDREAVLIERICLKAGIEAPVYGGAVPIGTAMYAQEVHAIFVSGEFFEQLSDSEAEFVLAHEVGHAVARKTNARVDAFIQSGKVVLLVGAAAALGHAVLARVVPWWALVLPVAWMAHTAFGGWLRFSYCEMLADRFAARHLGSSAWALRLLERTIQKHEHTPDAHLRRRLKCLQSAALEEMPLLAVLPQYQKY